MTVKVRTHAINRAVERFGVDVKSSKRWLAKVYKSSVLVEMKNGAGIYESKYYNAAVVVRDNYIITCYPIGEPYIDEENNPHIAHIKSGRARLLKNHTAYLHKSHDRLRKEKYREVLPLRINLYKLRLKQLDGEINEEEMLQVKELTEDIKRIKKHYEDQEQLFFAAADETGIIYGQDLEEDWLE